MLISRGQVTVTVCQDSVIKCLSGKTTLKKDGLCISGYLMLFKKFISRNCVISICSMLSQTNFYEVD